MTIQDTNTGDAEGLPPSTELPWAELGFAPWVQPTYLRLRNTALRFELATRRLRHRTRTWLRPQFVLVAMVLAYVVLFGWLTWVQQSNFGTTDYDMGIFDQEIWLGAHHLNPFLTIRGLNMWANHVNPVVYLLVPFYWLGAGPHFLFIVQTLAFGVAAIPLWLLARDRFASPWLALSIPLAWFLYPAVEWMTWDQFHPEMLGIPAFIFAYWLADRGYWRWYAVCVVLVLAGKEDAALPIIALGLVLAFRRHWRAGVITIVGAVAWFLLCIALIIPTAMGGLTPFFLYQYAGLGDSMPQILYNFVRHPSRAVGLILNHSRYRYYEQLIVPVAGLALLAPITLLLVVPTLLENVTNNQGYPYDIKYQYSAFVAAGIFLALIEAIGRYRSRALRYLLVGIVSVCALFSNVAWSTSPLDGKVYHGGYWVLDSSPQRRTLDKMVHMVPATAVVSATYSEVPHLSHRDQLYTWPNPWIRSYYGVSETQPPEHPAAVQYLVFDLTEITPTGRLLLWKLTRPGGPFHIIMERNEALLAIRVRPGA